jgi:ribonuclease HII
MNDLPGWSYERAAWDGGHVVVAGVDEAGRGPLAGPVLAAAIVLPGNLVLEGIRDSKQLTPEARDTLYEILRTHATAISVAAVGPERIDEVNILCATHEAMAAAVAGLPALPDLALVDGLAVRGLPCAHQAIVKGDACCVSISAASIIAKVTRDRLMVSLDAQFPGYGFAQHKGYPTPAHRDALRRFGPFPIHRRTFRPVREGVGR